MFHWIESSGRRLWRSSWQPVITWLLLLLLGYWLIFSDPFGLGGISDDASQKTIYRLSANLYDHSKGQENIVVVVFNDRSIENLYPSFLQSNDWPLSYQDQVGLLTTVMAQAPSAIFYDVMWMKRRSMDPGFERAITALKLNQQATGVPLFFAAGTATDLQKNNVITPLEETVTPVITAWDDAGDDYPLLSGTEPSAGFALYQHYCKQQNCETSPELFEDRMSVRWSSYVAPALPHRQNQCEEPQQSMIASAISIGSDIVSSAFHQDWMESEHKPVCLSHQILFWDEVVAMARSEEDSVRQQLKSLLAGKLVLVGGQIEGVYDFAESPVHGTVPGVMMHAMALDNLLNYGPEYLRNSDLAGWWLLTYWGVFALFLTSINHPGLTHPLLVRAKDHYRVVGLLFALLLILLNMKLWHFAPSGWISLLALGFAGQKFLQGMSERFSTVEKTDAN